MAYTAEQIMACKAYMRAEEEQDAVVEPLMEAAAEYIGISGVETLSPLQALALHSLTLYYYDHRDAVGNEADMPKGLGPILTKLKVGQLAE